MRSFFKWLIYVLCSCVYADHVGLFYRLFLLHYVLSDETKAFFFVVELLFINFIIFFYISCWLRDLMIGLLYLQGDFFIILDNIRQNLILFWWFLRIFEQVASTIINLVFLLISHLIFHAIVTNRFTKTEAIIARNSIKAQIPRIRNLFLTDSTDKRILFLFDLILLLFYFFILLILASRTNFTEAG